MTGRRLLAKSADLKRAAPEHPVYILAGRYENARDIARQYGLAKDEWNHIFESDQLRGLRASYLHIVYPLGQRQVGLADEARRRGWQIVEIQKPGEGLKDTA